MVDRTAPILTGGPTVASIDRSYVNNGAQLTPIIQRYYSLFLWNLEQGTVVEDATLDPAKRRPSAEYFFETPPKVAEMTEPFTTRVIATQNGGKFIESHGSIFKEIRLQGTTGLRPRKGAPNVIPLLPIAPTNAFSDEGFGNAVRTIPESEATGFDDIHFLRNLFRRYSDSKARGEKMVMVWRNIKDNDYWIVEPRDFKLTQNSQSPLTYQYQISLQGLSQFEETTGLDVPQDPLSRIRDAQRFASRIQEFKQNLTASFLVLATQVTRIQGAGYFAINNTLGTLTSIIKGLDSVVSRASAVDDNLMRAVNQGVQEFDEAVAALQETLEPTVVVGGQDTVVARDDIIREFRNAGRRICPRILSEPSLNTSISQRENDVRGRIRSQYRTPGAGTGAPTATSSGGDPTFIGNSASPRTVGEGTVGIGETIRDLSRRFLGDFRRWHELVLLNDLRAPYTSDGPARSGVLVPGDKILYPSTQTEIVANTITNQSLSPDEQDGSLDNPEGLLSQTYGRDLRLKSTVGAGSVALSDLAVNQRGDIATIVGVPNVQQALRIRFLTEQGELVAHPVYGAKFPIGSKADVFSFNTFRVNTLATLRSDPRIKDVLDLNFVAVADTLFVDTKLMLLDRQEYANTRFAIRRF